jgi:hypothetical protein
LCHRLNNPDFDYCLQNKACPLTDLKITTSAVNPDKSLFNDEDFVQSQSNTFLWFSNRGSGGPLTDLKISQLSPCFDSRLISWGITRPKFELNYAKVTGCVSDERYKDLEDTINERELFTLNQAAH